MAKKSAFLSSTTLLGLGVGVFLLVSGLQSLIDQSSLLGKALGLFQDQTSKTLLLIAAVLKLVSGAVLIIGPFGLLTAGLRKLAFWIIVGFWAVLTVWVAVGSAGSLNQGTNAVLAWLQTLSLNVAILAALWHLDPEA